MSDVLMISNSHHLAIADAIIAREGARAEAVAREHSRMVRRSISLALEERRFAAIPGGMLIKSEEGADADPGFEPETGCRPL